MRFLEVGERKEQVREWRTEVGLCADTTYAMIEWGRICGMEREDGLLDLWITVR